MDKSLKTKLSIFYAEILKGYSLRSSESFGDFYIKHFSQLDSCDVDSERDRHYHKAVAAGIPTEDEALQQSISDGLWSAEKEREILDIETAISRAQETRNKLTLKSQKIPLDRRIKDYAAKLDSINSERFSLFGMTAENFAAKKMNEYYICKAAYSDPSLTKPMFSTDQFDEFEDHEINSLSSIYGSFMLDFSPQNLKRVSLSQPFMEIYNLCNDDAYQLFGRPIYQLTFFQRDIFATMRHFKNVLTDAKYRPSLDMYDDPDQLAEWMNSGATGGNDGQSPDKVVATSYVGASKDDLKDLGVDGEDSVSLSKAAAKKGGSLDMKDIMKLHGYKV